MSYKVTAPLVIVANDDKTSGDWYGYNGALVPAGWNDARCKQLVKEGMLERVVEEAAPAAPDTVEAILAGVGDDKAKAAVALETERAKGDDARSTLVKKLEAIVTPQGA